MIEVTGLSFSYNATPGISFPNFTVNRGKNILLLGESGSGKTTLLHLLGGLLRGYAGSVKVDGTELSSLSETALDRFRGQRIGFVFQKNHLINSLTVQQNLRLAPYLAGMAISDSRITEVLEELGITNKKASRIQELSHGQAQRVSIARAVLNKPSIIIADEPTSALDDTSCSRVIELLARVAAENNSSLIIATHDQRLRDRFSDRVELQSHQTAGESR